MGRFSSLLSALGQRTRALPTGLKVVLGVGLLAVLAVGSVLLYRTYEFVEHDNQFCLQCHLMRDPYERFARSAHRDLGCKACHRPNIVERSTMGLAQVIEQPDEIRVHAHVPNEVCAECHIEGDPESWRHIANTAGHRIHLESDDPVLRGFQCVECHSTGIHEFAPTDRTCGQAGCHEATTIELGKMADITIHCATCHEFTAPVPESALPAEVATSMRPQAEECMSCHEMRLLLTDFPPDEPHDAVCGACHNPHTQETPRQAVQTCGTAGCHERPEDMTPYHRGLGVGVLEDCLACHEAHDFRVPPGGTECLACHSDIYQDAPSGRVSPSAAAHPPVRPVTPADRPAEYPSVRLASAGGAAALAPGLERLARARHLPNTPTAPAPRQVDQQGAVMTRDTLRFWHAQHRGVECTECHSVRDRHGAVTVTSLRDCRSCHHTEPVATPCAGCHDQGAVRRLQTTASRVMDIRVGTLNRPRRPLPFDHGDHLRYECQQCHTQGLALSASGLQCAQCHEEHHQGDVSCMSCHPSPADGAHDLNAHLTCTGAGCHTAPPATVQAIPRTRDFCLACHQDLVDHRPGRNCVSCHALPAGAGP
jgi:nitrate/TMAO reductase-like tetraheme cytochrome c subunit